MNTDRDKPTEAELREALKELWCDATWTSHDILNAGIVELIELRKVLTSILPYLEMKLSEEDIKRIKGVMGESSK